MFKQFTSLLVTLVFATTVYGQQGAISGTVFDEDGFPMLGANVVIQGTAIGAQTDYIEGKFQFKADVGVYTIVASYVGYGDQIVEGVIVAGNETTILDFNFTTDAAGGIDLGEIVVTGKAINNGEVAVMKLRQNSDKVQDIISAQEMSRLGASNVASAMSKVTGTTVVDGKYVYVRGLGDRYSATTVNGLRLPSTDPYRNSAQLDIIPTNLLDNIVASKTFTPDLPGDFTGGSVNIELKSLPERFTWGISASGSYNTVSSFRDDFRTFDAGSRSALGFNDGTLDLPSGITSAAASDLDVLDRRAARRAFPNDELAGLLNNAAKELGAGFSQTTKSTPLDFGLSANIGNQFQIGNMPVGFFATASYSRDYSYREGTRANYFNPGDSEVLFRDFDLQDKRSVEAAKIGGMVGLSFKPSPANEINLYSIYSHQGFLEGRVLTGANDNYGLAGTPESFFYSQTNAFKEQQLMDYVAEGTHTLTGLGNVKLEWAANYIETSQDEPDTRFIAYTSQNGFTQINEAELILPSSFFRELNDNGYQGKIDITVPFLQEKSRGNAIKFGGLYNTKERDFNEASYNFLNRDGLSLNDVNGSIEELFAASNLGVIGGESGANQIGLYVSENTTLSNSYTGQSDITAAYAMVTYEFSDRFKAIAGVRLESTKLDIESDQAAVAINPEDFKANIDTTALLPALNLVYKVNERSNLRGSFTQTIARPNMREIAPFGAFPFIGGVPVFGNRDLELTNINNFDLRYEIFPNAGEVIAFSAFYKKFTNPIVTTFRNAGQQQFTWTNSESAELYGVELEFRKSLGFLSSKLDNFTFNSNFSYLQSSQKIAEKEVRQGLELDPEFSSERAFNGQSPIVVNANLSWDNPDTGWGAIIAFNYFGDRLQSIGAVGTSDIFERGRSSLDLSASKKLNNFNFTLRAKNLLNPAYETFSEFRGQEYLFSSYERGQEISMGISYSL
ncbi:MAG: outer membrane receptor protein involved in Fe transport [Neolewinella sp.]|jgi:outer membrane receptor protein involved in Fe transport